MKPLPVAHDRDPLARIPAARRSLNAAASRPRRSFHIAPLAVLAAATLFAAASALWGVLAAPATSATPAQAQLAGPPHEQTLYGHIKSLTRKGARFELRFDPAFWLGGVTATRAAVEDKVIPPGDIVPNDYYIRDETHRLLTYRVPPTAHVTVLTQGPRSTAISVSELAQIVKGKNPKHRALYDRGNHLGYWIGFRIDTVRSLDQQYQP